MPAGRFKTTVSAPEDFPNTQEYARYLAGILASNFGEMNWLFGNLDSVNIKNLTAEKIVTGILNAALVMIRAKDDDKYFKFDKEGIIANNGEVDTLRFDLSSGLLTIVSALIQSAEGFPKVELNSQENMFAAFKSADDWIKIATSIMSTTALMMYLNGIGVQHYLFNSGVAGYYYYIQTDGHIEIRPGTGKNVNFPSPSRVLFNGDSLQELLDDLQDQINALKSSGTT